MQSLDNKVIGIIGLGYVGLPLALAFSKKFKVIGFDIDRGRIHDLKKSRDQTKETNTKEIDKAVSEKSLIFSDNKNDLKEASIYIVTVPTPINSQKEPDLLPLISASETIGSILSKDDVVVYESTVFPGATEEECIPVLEEISGLKFNEDFYCGYSPERVNPGDSERSLGDIKKIVSGSTKEVSDFLKNLYSEIITAGIYQAKSIKVAEAAKIIENVQRDVNIALVNELAMLFNRLEINTSEVLEAASTKWNFLNFKPGLVGGHCIGIDPYYLTKKANSVGMDVKIVSSSRKVNDQMGIYVARHFLKLFKISPQYRNNGKILILGFSFKENCPDHRNTRVIDIYKELTNLGFVIDIHDPWVDPKEVLSDYGIQVKDNKVSDIWTDYDAVILAVAHDLYLEIDLTQKNRPYIYDIKSFLKISDSTL